MVYAVDIDDLKLHNLEHNAQIYNCSDTVQTVHKDFLQLTMDDVPGFTRNGGAMFLGPPWGGASYGSLESYSLDNIFPSFREILKTTLKQFTENMIIFLPRNTSIKELTQTISKVYAQVTGKSELKIEVEKITYNAHVKMLVVYTGKLA